MVEHLPASAGASGLIPGSGPSPRVGNGSPLQYSCLEIPSAEEPSGPQSWVAKSWMQLNTHIYTFEKET